MKKITKYVLKEFSVPLFYCLTGFISIYVLFELFGSFSRLCESDMPFSVIVQYFLAYLAPHFIWLAPAALMLATLYTMWNFCRHSELVAMRASGLGFTTIVKPILTVSILMTAFVFYVSESYVPKYAQWAKNLRTEKFDYKKASLQENLTFRSRQTGHTWTVGKVVDENTFQDVKVVFDRYNSATRKTSITASEAKYLQGEWWFTDAKVQHYDEKGSEIISPTPERDRLSFQVVPGLSERPDDIMAQNRDWKYNSVRDKFRYIRKHPNLSDDVKNEYIYDAWAGVTAPFACIIITLFAIPAGVASGRQSVFKGILGALGMFFAFYALTILCMILAQIGYMNPICAAFLPGVIFLAIGGRLFYNQR